MKNCILTEKRFIIFILTLLVAIFIPGVSNASESQGTYGGEYRIPLASEPITLDPAYYSDIYSFNVAQNLYDGLVEFDKDLRVIPGLAKRWKISRDHLTYTFSIRKGVKFHNGREVTADDFVYSFTRILSPEKKSPVASMFMEIAGARDFNSGKSKAVSGFEVPDPYTLKIKLEKPFAPFLSILAMINAKVVPKEAVGPDFGKKPIGTGPFKMASWEAGKGVVLAANKNYFAKRPYLDTLSFIIYPNIEWEKIFDDFQKGGLEQSIIPRDKFNLVSDSSNIKNYNFITKPGLNLVYIGLNSTMKPLDDKRVRQAFNYAVDKKRIVERITKRGSVPAKGILPPGIPGYAPKFKGYSYNPDKAKKLLAEAGYPGGKGIPPLTILTVSKSESVQKELQAYKKYMAEIGVTLVPKVANSWKEFLGQINNKKVPMFYAAWYADYPDADNFLYVLCHSKSKTNRMGYSKPAIDKMLEKGREELDYMKRVELYQEIEKLVMDDAPIISQHVNSVNYFFQPWVEGVNMNHLGSVYIPFGKIWIDRDKYSSAIQNAGQLKTMVE